MLFRLTNYWKLATIVIQINLLACSGPNTVPPPAANLVASDGTRVVGAPVPEVVQLRRIEMRGPEKYVTVGNVAGDYLLVCSLDVNEETGALRSCLSPLPQRDYLIFRGTTKWLLKGAKTPLSLEVMQDWTVTYNRHENVGLFAAKESNDEDGRFGVYWLSSWTAATGR